jgi:hypothetical protein
MVTQLARHSERAHAKRAHVADVTWKGRRSSPGSWLARMLARKPRMLVAVALANKMARAIWATGCRDVWSATNRMGT